MSWRKSSYSSTQEACVEVEVTASRVGVRDSKQADGPELAFPRNAFAAFLRHTGA